MKIKEISSSNFLEGRKILWNVKPDIDILVGNNGTGKTSLLLSTFNLIDEAGSQGILEEIKAKDFKIVFDNGLELEWRDNNKIPKVTGNGIENVCISSCFADDLWNVDINSLEDSLGILDDPDTFELFKPLIKKLLPDISSVVFPEVVKSGGKLIKGEDLSFSEKRLLEIITCCPFPDGSSDIYIVDYPELGLDLETQYNLIDVLLEFNPKMQLLLTTNSPSIFSKGYGVNVTYMDQL